MTGEPEDCLAVFEEVTKICFGYNAVPSKARDLILEVFDSGQFSPGPKVREFEEKFAALHKANHAVFVNSGTDALRLSLLALKEKYGWKDGDEVAVPALTFVATVNVILQAHLKPFFVDVSMQDYLINPSNLERRVQGSHTRLVAVMPVHLFGQSCRPGIFEAAKKYGLKVLEDSCETILNPLRGDVSCHSTYMAHHLTNGVGGFALTNDAELNLMIRSFANHGRNASYLPGYFKPAIGRNLLQSRFRFDRIGYSCRATEFEAALGLSQLGGLEENVQKRRYVFEDLKEALAEWDLFMTLEVQGNSCMMFPIVLKDGSPIDKYDLCLHLEKNGIETRDMMPVTNQPCYKGLVSQDDFQVAKGVNERGFYIPVHPAMTPQDVQQIKKIFKAFLTK